MPRKSSTGDYTFSASEIAEYIVCPEAWYHQRIPNSNKSESLPKEEQSEDSEQIKGEILHEEWAKEYAEGLSLARMLRIIASLATAATLIFLLQYDK